MRIRDDEITLHKAAEVRHQQREREKMGTRNRRKETPNGQRERKKEEEFCP